MAPPASNGTRIFPAPVSIQRLRPHLTTSSMSYRMAETYIKVKVTDYQR